VKRCIILKTADVAARNEKGAVVIEAKIPRIAGIERIALAALKPPPGEPVPTLHVEWLEYEGPLDTRTSATKTLMVFTPGKSQAEQTREVLLRFAVRAWRRPITAEELDRLAGLVAYAMGHNDSWEEAMRRAVSAILASPKFIFRLEPDDEPQNPEPHAINDFHLATRLSYFLWSSCPDDELLRLAASRKLAANLEAQIQRMLQDPRAGALVENFALQWLQLGRLAGHNSDPKTFQKWRPELREAMIEETRRFVGEIVRTDRSILDMLDGEFTWVNRQLAELYGLKSTGEIQRGEWKRVSLAGTSRGGLLTQASILTVTSNPTRTSPVKRGKWILEQVLGAPPPAPPPNTPSLDDAGRKELTGTFRQKLEQHRADPKCANCHAKMDAFGFALENFNGIGQWRDRDETGAPIDTAGKLASGRTVNGLSDMKSLLRGRRQEFARCITEKMFIYALGRGLDYYDEPVIDGIVASLEKGDYRFSALVAGIVKSPAFLMRRGMSQAEPEAAAK
jgi:PAS domain-containing protein